MAKGRTYQNIILMSTAGTGVFYVAQKPTKGEKANVKLQKMKYDNKARKRVMFVEQKLKYKAN